jgi:hypothetical protein
METLITRKINLKFVKIETEQNLNFNFVVSSNESIDDSLINQLYDVIDRYTNDKYISKEQFLHLQKTSKKNRVSDLKKNYEKF